MNKNTKILLGVAILGTGGYLIMKSLKPTPPLKFTGNLNPGPLVSKRQMSGGVMSKRKTLGSNKKKMNLTEIRTDVSKDSGWLRGDGTTMKNRGDFFNVKGSGWLRGK